jgi:hypothetical protein
MNKQKLIKKLRKQHQRTHHPNYIERIKYFANLFQNFPSIQFLTNHVLEADCLLQRGQLPQILPPLLLPENIQDTIFNQINQTYPIGDPRGDKLWNQYIDALPKLDQDLRNFRDYLEKQYGMWAYISAPFTKDIATFLHQQPALEVMAGNGYISKGLRDNGANIICTDSLDWKKENQTGHHLVTNVEKIDALDAFHKYKKQIKFVIMCWSPDGLLIDWELLQAIRQSNEDIQLIVIGEKHGATNSETFWDNVHFIQNKQVQKINQHHQPFDLIHDQLFIVQ